MSSNLNWGVVGYDIFSFNINTQQSFVLPKNFKMAYLFTSESVSEGHPDKVSDQISDALIDHFMAFDPSSKVACETLVTTGQVVLAGEVKSTSYLDVQAIARETIRQIGYTKSEYMFDANSCGIFSALHEQSAEWRMRAFQSSMPRVKVRMKFKTHGERKVTLTMMILLYNLRARMIGINQLRSFYMGALYHDASIEFVPPLVHT